MPREEIDEKVYHERPMSDTEKQRMRYASNDGEQGNTADRD